jgi:predicted RNase H-like nuclease (RuvC/YqgF family)
MQAEVKELFEQIHTLESAVSKLEARKETALSHIDQLQAKLPDLLEQYAIGQCKEAEISQVHAQILQLQQIANEPTKKAINALNRKIKELQGGQVLSQYRQEQKARAEHQRYVDHVNKALAAKELSAQDAVVLESIAPAKLKNEAKELIKQFKAYVRDRYSKGDAALFEEYVTVTPTPYDCYST